MTEAAAPTILEISRATVSAVLVPRIAFDGGFVVRRFAGGTGGRMRPARSTRRPTGPARPHRAQRGLLRARRTALPLPLRAAGSAGDGGDTGGAGLPAA